MIFFSFYSCKQYIFSFFSFIDICIFQFYIYCRTSLKITVVSEPSAKRFIKVQSKKFKDILENALIPTTHLLGIPRGWILQQDNAMCHTCRLVKEWFDEEQITGMNQPAQSLDLNSIENLWVRIKARVPEQNPKSCKEL